MTPTEAGTRPRIEGDREQEVLAATLDVLADVGYDRLTMDAVATQARASKATLYRRWNDKVSLVIDALLSQKGQPEAPDTARCAMACSSSSAGWAASPTEGRWPCSAAWSPPSPATKSSPQHSASGSSDPRSRPHECCSNAPAIAARSAPT